jgi:hypothetical protein
MASVGEPSVRASSVLGAWGAGEEGAGELGGGCAGFWVFGRGNGCGVCAAALIATHKLNIETQKHRSTELL